ncbi:MAG: permease [Dehalococcoidia bacterium]
MREFAAIFLALIFETTPFLLAGVLISVGAGRPLERALASAAFKNPLAGTLAGVSAGIALPMCDCGSRPLAHRLALAGRREFAIAFLVAAPVVNPIVVVTTWLAFRDPELLMLRLGITALMAVATALVVARFSGEIALASVVTAKSDEEGSFASRALGEFFELFQYLVVGAALAAVIQVFVDRSVLTSTGGAFLSISALMALAFLLSICSSVDAFVVAGFGGLGLGPVLAFLTFGPVMNLKSLPMYLRLFSLPVVLVIAVVAGEFAFLIGVAAEFRAW